MALTRKMLKEMSLSEENTEKIIQSHAETVEALKKYKNDCERLKAVEAELAAAKEELACGYKSKYEELSFEFECYKDKIAKDSIISAKRTAAAAGLRACGVIESCVEPILNVLDINNIALSEDGKIENQETFAEEIKNSWSAFIPAVRTKGADTAKPPVTMTEKGYSSDDIRRMSPKEINENYKEIKKSLSCGG